MQKIVPSALAADDSADEIVTQSRKNWLGRILLIGISLALAAALLPIWMVYSFIWIARI